ncbi:MAG: hypothetical protein J6W82_07870 [Bacteroidales bacterium]|nr:hypothetical protein [Bacteroidales bacterium]
MTRKLILALSILAVLCACKETPVTTDDPIETPPEKEPATWPEAGKANATYIANGKIQIGVDLERGGAVFHFSEYANKRNLLNHYDEGRFGHGPGGANQPSCSYFAPIRTLAITGDSEISYDVYLTIGSVEQIRSRFTQLHQQ